MASRPKRNKQIRDFSDILNGDVSDFEADSSGEEYFDSNDDLR